MIARVVFSHWPSLVLGSCLSIGLSAIGAGLALLIGPAIFILMTPTSDAANRVIPFTELVGDRMEPLISWLWGQATITSSELWQILPPLLVAVAVVKWILSIAQWFTWERLGERVARFFRSDMLSRLMNVRADALIHKDFEKASESVNTIVTNDVKYLQEYVVRCYGGLPREVLQLVAYLTTMIMLNPKMTAVFMLGVLPAIAVLNRVGRKIRKRANKALEDYSDLAEWIQQRLEGIEMIKHFKSEKEESRRMDKFNLQLEKRFLRALSAKAKSSPTLEILTIIAIAAVIYVAFIDINSGATTSSVQMTFFASLGLLGQAAGKIGRYYNTSREGLAAMDRVVQTGSVLKRYEAKELSRIDSVTSDSTCSVDGLSYKYPGEDVEAVSNVTLEFSRGKSYCIVGASGAGKSTLMKLMLGLLVPQSGTIGIESGVDADSIGFLPQRPKIFPGTIAENVSYPRSEVDAAKVEKALEMVNLDSWVNRLPDKQATIIGKNGREVSGGQGQRIMMARLHYHHFPLVLIDEGTSAVDAVSEAVIFDSFSKLAKNNVCVITIAHRKAAVLASDFVVVMRQGQVVASGPKNEVIENDEFKRIFNS